MDVIYLRNLRIETVIGVYEWERRIRQIVELNLEIAVDAKKAAAKDTIDSTVDYNAVAQRLIAFVSASEFQLVETLAEKAAEIVIKEFGANSLKLSISKTGAVRGATEVGVAIERTKKDFS